MHFVPLAVPQKDPTGRLVRPSAVIEPLPKALTETLSGQCRLLFVHHLNPTAPTEAHFVVLVEVQKGLIDLLAKQPDEQLLER